MRINLNQISNHEVELQESSSNKPAEATNTPSASVQDRTSLANDAATVASLQDQALAFPDVRQSKIDALKQQIVSGEYKVDANEIAKGMRDHGL